MSDGSPLILVVDDRPEIRFHLRDILESGDYRVIEAGHGEEALEVVAKESVDVVITDLRMPHLGGMELLERLQQERADLPVVILTGFASLPIYMKAFTRGAYYFLEKPARNEELLAIMEKALSGSPAPVPTP